MLKKILQRIERQPYFIFGFLTETDIKGKHMPFIATEMQHSINVS